MFLFTLHNFKIYRGKYCPCFTGHCRSRKVRRIVSSHETSIMQLIQMKNVPGSQREAVGIYVS